MPPIASGYLLDINALHQNTDPEDIEEQFEKIFGSITFVPKIPYFHHLDLFIAYSPHDHTIIMRTAQAAENDLCWEHLNEMAAEINAALCKIEDTLVEAGYTIASQRLPVILATDDDYSVDIYSYLNLVFVSDPDQTIALYYDFNKSFPDMTEQVRKTLADMDLIPCPIPGGEEQAELRAGLSCQVFPLSDGLKAYPDPNHDTSNDTPSDTLIGTYYYPDERN